MSLVAVNLTVTAGDAGESVYGLGQVSISVTLLDRTPPRNQRTNCRLPCGFLDCGVLAIDRPSQSWHVGFS
jgi:hypothetical protein